VPVSGEGPHCGRDPDRLHQLLWSCPTAQSRLCVALDAPRGLRYVSDGDRNNLLSLRRQSPIGEDGFVKRVKSRVLIRR
jgi:hypothetical protein